MERDGWMGRIAFVALPGCVCESRGMTVCVGGKTSPHPRKKLDCSRNPILFGRQQNAMDALPPHASKQWQTFFCKPTPLYQQI